MVRRKCPVCDLFIDQGFQDFTYAIVDGQLCTFSKTPEPGSSTARIFEVHESCAEAFRAQVSEGHLKS
jgi:hypothetical protein